MLSDALFTAFAYRYYFYKNLRYKAGIEFSIIVKAACTI